MRSTKPHAAAFRRSADHEDLLIPAPPFAAGPLATQLAQARGRKEINDERQPRTGA